jgi:hypothetical protein
MLCRRRRAATAAPFFHAAEEAKVISRLAIGLAETDGSQLRQYALTARLIAGKEHRVKPL